MGQAFLRHKVASPSPEGRGSVELLLLDYRKPALRCVTLLWRWEGGVREGSTSLQPFSSLNWSNLADLEGGLWFVEYECLVFCGL
jgi:hypothetical protein